MSPNSYLDRAAIQRHQLEMLQSLLAEILPGNKFYTRKLEAEGVTFEVPSLKSFSERVPFTIKSELVEDQLKNPPWGTNLTYPLECYTRYHQTSGTSGVPLRWLDTLENWEWMLESWTEILEVAGLSASDRVFFAFSFGPFIGFWLAFESAARLGCLSLPGGGLSSAARLQSILDNRVTAVCCTPTYAIRLAEVAAEENIDLAGSQVRVLIVAGEPGGSIPSVRTRLAELWHGAAIFDHHGMTETGPVTYQCPSAAGVMHVMEKAYFPEILASGTLSPVSPGQTGELVLTTLGRTGSPLLRYRTGDLVKPLSAQANSDAKPCLCGRYELALEGGILGRVDDMIVIRGVNVYPSAVEEIVRSHAGIAEYQVQVSNKQTLPELSLQIEPAADCANVAELVRQLERKFETALALRVPVTLAPVGTLPRFEMKGRRWRKV